MYSRPNYGTPCEYDSVVMSYTGYEFPGLHQKEYYSTNERLLERYERIKCNARPYSFAGYSSVPEFQKMQRALAESHRMYKSSTPNSRYQINRNHHHHKNITVLANDNELSQTNHTGQYIANREEHEERINSQENVHVDSIKRKESDSDDSGFNEKIPKDLSHGLLYPGLNCANSIGSNAVQTFSTKPSGKGVGVSGILPLKRHLHTISENLKPIFRSFHSESEGDRTSNNDLDDDWGFLSYPSSHLKLLTGSGLSGTYQSQSESRCECQCECDSQSQSQSYSHCNSSSGSNNSLEAAIISFDKSSNSVVNSQVTQINNSHDVMKPTTGLSDICFHSSQQSVNSWSTDPPKIQTNNCNDSKFSQETQDTLELFFNMFELNDPERCALKKVSVEQLTKLLPTCTVVLPKETETGRRAKHKRRLLHHLRDKSFRGSTNGLANSTLGRYVAKDIALGRIVAQVRDDRAVETDYLQQNKEPSSRHRKASLTLKGGSRDDSWVGSLSLSLEDAIDRQYGKPADNCSAHFLHVPYVVRSCCKHLYTYGLNKEGLFRVAGLRRRILELKNEFDSGSEVLLTEETRVHDVASLLKEFLRDLPDPLLTMDLYPAFLATRSIQSIQERIEALSCLVSLLPVANRDTLWVLLQLLAEVSRRALPTADGTVGNKMDSANLATVIAPNILHRSKKGKYQVETMEEAMDRDAIVSVVKDLIDHHKAIFTVDKQKYFLVAKQLYPLLAQFTERLDLGSSVNDVSNKSAALPISELKQEYVHHLQQCSNVGEGHSEHRSKTDHNCSATESRSRRMLDVRSDTGLQQTGVNASCVTDLKNSDGPTDVQCSLSDPAECSTKKQTSQLPVCSEQKHMTAGTSPRRCVSSVCKYSNHPHVDGVRRQRETRTKFGDFGNGDLSHSCSCLAAPHPSPHVGSHVTSSDLSAARRFISPAVDNRSNPVTSAVGQSVDWQAIHWQHWEWLTEQQKINTSDRVTLV